jgi:Flp pilus assembly protein TadD
MILEKQERFSEAESLHKTTLAARRKVLGNANTDTLSSLANLGGLYLTQRRFQDAEPLLLECARSVLEDPAVNREQRRSAVSAVVELYRTWDRPKEAADWQIQLDRLDSQPAH